MKQRALAVFQVPSAHADKFRAGAVFTHDGKNMKVIEVEEKGAALQITAVQISDKEARPKGLTIYTVTEKNARGMKVGDIFGHEGAQMVVTEIGAVRTDRTGCVVDVMATPVPSGGAVQ